MLLGASRELAYRIYRFRLEELLKIPTAVATLAGLSRHAANFLPG